nr:hypothetical protein [Tanacetum cinerariifolium]GFA32458.1 hypothetical protein [Tanacetum cinerariifolium]
KGLLGPRGGSCGGKVRGCSGNGERGGSMAERGGGEVKGGGVDFGVSKSLLGEIPRVMIGESGEETFGFNGGAVW